MKIAVKDLAPCEKMISINVPEDDIKQEYEVVYREIGKVAKIPGFRPGKAPIEMVTKHYREAAKEEVLKQLISKSLKNAFKEKDIHPLMNPEVREVDFKDDNLKFEAYVETRPEVKLGKYIGIKVKKNIPAVDSSEVDQVIERLRDNYAKFSPVENRGLEKGDVMIADLKVSVDGKEIESRQDSWIEYREKAFLPEFEEAVVGLQPGTEKEIEVPFPEDYPNKQIAGKKGLFKLKLKEIKKRDLPALNDDWAKEVGEYKTLEDLREAVKRDLKEEKGQQEEHRIQNELLETLVKSSSFDIPKNMVERRLNHLTEEAVQNMLYQGYKQEEAVKEKDKIREKLKAEAEKQVRLSFILDTVSEKEKIEVTEDELDAKFDELAKRSQQPKAKVLEYYQSENLLNGLVIQVLNQKVSKFLREKAEVTE